MTLILQANILVDQTFHARLTDFGLTAILPDSTLDPDAQGSTSRWMSPELFAPETKNYRCRWTKCSDCYAFGMVIYEVLGQRLPFYEYPDLGVCDMVLAGDRPEKPEGTKRTWFIADVWELLERCWLPDPHNRPSIEYVLERLEQVSKSWSALSRSFAILSTAGSSTGLFLDQSAEESMDANRIPSPSPSQSSKEAEQERSVGVSSKVRREDPLCEF
jgi:hypothetical protein